MDFQGLMKQAQMVQQKFQEAQAKVHETTATGTSGAGLVSVEIRGTHEILSIKIDDSLMQPGQAEVLSDLVKAAHDDARRRLEEVNAKIMEEVGSQIGAAGGLPNMPKFF